MGEGDETERVPRPGEDVRDEVRLDARLAGRQEGGQELRSIEQQPGRHRCEVSSKERSGSAQAQEIRRPRLQDFRTPGAHQRAPD